MHKNMKLVQIVYAFIGIFFVCPMINSLMAQKGPAFLTGHNQYWVDSIFQTMTLEMKIGQLLMPRANYSGKAHNKEQLKEWVQKYHIGGLVFFASNPTTQAQIVNEIQATSTIPLLIGQDFEWGLAMRLDSTPRFPYGVALGAISDDDDLIEAMSTEIGRQCRRLGVHVNYAPVIDINNNPNNPVINFRSYGSNKMRVAKKGISYMKGLQSQNIICTAKHFPGHGDTDNDSHFTLPVLLQSKERLEDVELYPFKKLINEGLTGVMTAHLNIPALEPIKGLASTFSKSIITNTLIEKLNFDGLIFTDAMEMEGAIKNYPKGEAMVQALLAGNDILETFIDVPEAFEAIKRAVMEKRITQKMLDQKVKKILMAKSWVGLDNYQPVVLDGLFEDLNSTHADWINRDLAESYITCLKNELNLLPIIELDQKIAVLTIDADDPYTFVNTIKKYTQIDNFAINTSSYKASHDSIINSLNNYDLVIVSLHWSKPRASANYGINPENTRIIKELAGRDNVIMVLLGNPFALHKLPEFSKSQTFIVGYQPNIYTESAVPQILFGALPAKGVFPIDISREFYEGMSVQLPTIKRLSYGIPEQVGMNSETIHAQLDELIYEAIAKNAFPGCVLQVALEGKVIIQKAYGSTTYENEMLKSSNESHNINKYIDDVMDEATNHVSSDNNRYRPLQNINAITTDHIYDLASLTKILAPTLVALQWVSQGKITFDTPISDIYLSWKNTQKQNINFGDAMTHRSGLKPWIPFWKNAIDSLAMVKYALEVNPILRSEFEDQKKQRNWFQKIFKLRKSPQIDFLHVMKQKPHLWDIIEVNSPKIWKNNTFKNIQDSTHTIQVANNLWMHYKYVDTIYTHISNSPVKNYGNYVYSDLHYYLYPELSKKLTGVSFQELTHKIYKRIGAHSLVFRPLDHFELSKIVPTEYDSLFRNQLLHGYVHDEGAAMMGGVSGHAGLFGNGNDVMKIMQMYLQKGYYGGKRYIEESVVMQATAYQYPNENNRRGLGFDKKDFSANIINAPLQASEESFGHMGFTGTYTWADPKYDLVYVFLSNRVYPTRQNQKINELKVRQNIGDIIISNLNTKRK